MVCFDENCQYVIVFNNLTWYLDFGGYGHQVRTTYFPGKVLQIFSVSYKWDFVK